MSLDNHLLLRAIRKEPVERTPVWIMRQAGRYLPEYIKLKNQAGGFMNLIKNPELACEITLQPLERFNLDSAIIFSDILVITELFGIELEFIEKVGPVLSKTLRTEDDLKKINNDFVLAMTGYQPNYEILENLGVEILKDEFRTPFYNKETMETNVKGVFLAGVICGGLKTNKWFIENSRDHSEKIIGTILKN